MNMIIKPDLPAEDTELPDNLALYAKALRITLGEPKRALIQMQIANMLYYLVLCAILMYLFFMAIDRSVPVEIKSREIVNIGRQVEPGQAISVKSTRIRHRQCEMVRRYAVIDGVGRRIDYEPEPFDAYGPVSEDTETDITGPVVTLDAASGRGRLIASFSWDCNILQRALGWSITVVPKPLEFEIVPRRAQ